MKIIKENKCLFCLILIPYIYLIIICCYRTNQSALLTGDVENVNSLIEVENAKASKGSFNTIYVIDFDHSTIFQNRLVNNSKINTSTSVSDTYNYMTNEEISLMGKIQHDSSIEGSLIAAYKAAMVYDSNVRINYSLKGALVSYYTKEASDFKIGDLIIGINDYYISDDIDLFRDNFNVQKENDVLHILRNDENVDIVLNENNYRHYSIYAKYDIDYDSSVPKIKVNSTNVNGPSGGLLQTLDVFNNLVEADYSLGKKIAGTGTININGQVGGIGAVEQKIYTAYKRGVDVFFCPSVNYDDALKAYNTLKHKERMALVKVDTLDDALAYLKNELEAN